MQANITIGVIVLLICTTSIIISYNYLNNKKNVMNLSENLIFQMNKTIIHRTSTYLTPVIELVKMASEHIKTEIIYIQDIPRLDTKVK